METEECGALDAHQERVINYNNHYLQDKYWNRELNFGLVNVKAIGDLEKDIFFLWNDGGRSLSAVASQESTGLWAVLIFEEFCSKVENQNEGRACQREM